MIIKYEPSLRVANIDQLPRGTGCRYLEVIQHGAVFVAKQWRRKPADSKATYLVFQKEK
jgi:hypothetical protein